MKKDVWLYLSYLFTVILAVLGTFFFVKGYACEMCENHTNDSVHVYKMCENHTYQRNFYVPCHMEIHYAARENCSVAPWDYQNRANAETRKKWQEEYEFHMFHAKRTLADAKEKCWYLPNISNRQKARYCWTSMVTTLGSSTPQAKLASGFCALLIQYGLDCMDEWDYIQEKLHWSQYHFELCEHYVMLMHQA